MTENNSKETFDNCSITSVDQNVLNDSDWSELDSLVLDFESDSEDIHVRPPSPCLTKPLFNQRSNACCKQPPSTELKKKNATERSYHVEDLELDRSTSQQKQIPTSNPTPETKRMTDLVQNMQKSNHGSVEPNCSNDNFLKPIEVFKVGQVKSGQMRSMKSNSSVSSTKSYLDLLDNEYDELSLYAPDEDCISLYNNCPPDESKVIVRIETRTAEEDRDNVQHIPKNSRIEVMTMKNDIVRSNSDLRSLIPASNKNFEDVVKKIKYHLQDNTCSQSLVAAVLFCKAYKDDQIKTVDKEFEYVTKRLTEMLYHFHEMNHLYRIVRLSIDLHIVSSDLVLVGLIDHLGKQGELDKINVLFRQMRERSLQCSQIVYAAKNRYVPDLLKRKLSSNKNEPQHKRASLDPTCSRSCVAWRSASNEPAVNRNVKQPLVIQISNTTNSVAKSSAYQRRLVKINDWGSPSTSKGEKSLVVKIPKGDSKNIDSCMECVWIALGTSVKQLLEILTPGIGEDSVFALFSNLLASCKMKIGDSALDEDFCPILKPFLNSALKSFNKNTEASGRNWLSWICVDLALKINAANAYKIIYLLKSMGLKLIPKDLDGENMNVCHAKRKKRFQVTERIVKVCLEANDLDLVMQIITDFFEVRYTNDAGPVLSPLICNMLCLIASTVCERNRFFEAAECLSLLPEGYGDGAELRLLEKVLLGVVKKERRYSQKEEEVCTGMISQMLSRGMATEIRRVISSLMCANVFPVFKFLEAKGVYRRPRISDSPHLVVMPFVLSVEEMALVVHRHLTELSLFLVEIKRGVRCDIPMRIALSKKVGSLEPLTLSAQKPAKFDSLYEEARAHLHQALEFFLDPGLVVVNESIHYQTKEIIFIISLASVLRWMKSNTQYNKIY